MSRVHRLRAICVSSLATLLGCHLIGGAGDLEFTDVHGTGGTGGSAGGTTTGGGGQGGSTTCGNGQVEPGEVCFPNPHDSYETAKGDAADMVVLDCNGDGAPDVITANQEDGSFTVLTNDGYGALAGVESFPSGLEPSAPIRIALAELHGGGLPELLAIGIDGSEAEAFVEFSINDCSLGTRAVAGAITGAPRDVTVVRFGTDTLDDPVATVVVGSGAGAEPRIVYVQNDVGGYDPEDHVLAGTPEPAGIAAGNLDGDENIDVAYVDPVANRVMVRVGVNPGFGEVFSHDVGAGPTAVALGDLDGQPGDEVVVANTDDNSLSVLMNDGSGTLTKSDTDLSVVLSDTVPAGRPRDVHLADLDGDGDLDILTANSNESPTVDHSSVSLFLNDGDGGFLLATGEVFAMVQTSFPREVGLFPSRVWAADMNGDGALDIITSGTHIDGGTSHVSVLLAVP